MLIVSPWSRGGWVNSQLFDHTSLIRFLEARFADHRHDLVESNITPWRRAVVGDLTSAFDFKTPNASRRIHLPSITDFEPVELVRHEDEVPVPPAHGAVPRQEQGVRAARAIPYTLHADGHVAVDGSFHIHFRNAGRAGAVFHVRSANSAEVPRSYTVESEKHLGDRWSVVSVYDLSVYGPNGFFRGFKGGVTGRHPAQLEIRASYDEEGNEITLEVVNRSVRRVQVSVFNAYTSRNTRLSLAYGESESKRWPLARTGGWYDLTITVDEDARFEYRYAGHLENGHDSISDPMMGGLV
jgi:phospholipase C